MELTPLDHPRTQEALAGQVDDYADLSRWYAARGSSRLAALAVWASDVRAVQALQLQSGLSLAEDLAKLLSVAASLETALQGRETSAEVSVRHLVGAGRSALLTACDESVRAQLEACFVSLDHLEDLPAPTAGSANREVTDRLAGRGPEQLVGDLLTAAGDCRAVAYVMALTGDVEEARRQVVAADLAGFEAYLVLNSAASGDATLATTQLRSDLAFMRAARDDASLGTSPWSADALRAAILATLVPSEAPVLLSFLDIGSPEAGSLDLQSLEAGSLVGGQL